MLLDEPADAAWMQAVAAEVNLSETAFLWELPRPRRCHASDDRVWSLRWFTPTVEVDLCGHATLASAHHLFRRPRRTGGGAAVRDPQRPAHGASAGPTTGTAAAGSSSTCRPTSRCRSSRPTRSGSPCSTALGGGRAGRGRAGSHRTAGRAGRRRRGQRRRPRSPGAAGQRRGTASSSPAPGDGRVRHGVALLRRRARGIDEDPVTGSAHCTLGPYWGARVGRTELRAHQASAAGRRAARHARRRRDVRRRDSGCGWPVGPCTPSSRVLRAIGCWYNSAVIVSHRWKFIFVKTRKTAGSSIERFLLPHLGPDDVVRGIARPQRGRAVQPAARADLAPRPGERPPDPRAVGPRRALLPAHAGLAAAQPRRAGRLGRVHDVLLRAEPVGQARVLLLLAQQGPRRTGRRSTSGCARRRTCGRGTSTPSTTGSRSTWWAATRRCEDDLAAVLDRIGLDVPIDLPHEKSGFRPGDRSEEVDRSRRRSTSGWPSTSRREIQLMGYQRPTRR